ncbi:MAG: hypothetical protein ACPGUD_02210 [Parashewanella sp.]
MKVGNDENEQCAYLRINYGILFNLLLADVRRERMLIRQMAQKATSIEVSSECSGRQAVQKQLIHYMSEHYPEELIFYMHQLPKLAMQQLIEHLAIREEYAQALSQRQ